MKTISPSFGYICDDNGNGHTVELWSWYTVSAI